LLTTQRLILSALFACAVFAGPARAEVENQTVGELQAYIKLSDRFRLYTTASLTKSLTDNVTDGDVGAYLDILSINRIFRQRLLDIDQARNRDLWGRIGYDFGGINERVGRERDYREKEFVAELYSQYPITEGFWLEARARFDMRTVNTGRANRYRVRLGMDKTFTLFGKEVVTYARAEVLYDSRFGAWNQQVFKLGADIDLTEHFSVEPYYAYQIDSDAQPAHVNTVGLVLKYYR
jgi:Protein of unknown function (DUF2490)